jgi:arsenite-transporting ATPase
MRILLFRGKGGVGKTSLSAATGTCLAELGYRTLVMTKRKRGQHQRNDRF